MREPLEFVCRTIRTVERLARDGRIPKPMRWAAVVGLLPVPGPFDELVLLIVAAVLWIVWRDLLIEAWRQPRPDASCS